MTDKDLARIKAALAYDQGLSPEEGRALVAALEEARQWAQICFRGLDTVNGYLVREEAATKGPGWLKEAGVTEEQAT